MGAHGASAPCMGWAGLKNFWRKNHGWAGPEFDNPWVDFLRPSPAHSDLCSIRPKKKIV